MSEQTREREIRPQPLTGRTAAATRPPAGRSRPTARQESPVRIVLSCDDALTEAGLLEHLLLGQWAVTVGLDEAPDVALLAAPDLGPLAVDRLRLLADSPCVPVVVVTGGDGHWREGELLTLAEHGVRSVVARSEVTADRLRRAVTVVHDGGGDLPAAAQGRLLRDVARLQREVLAPHGLSASGLSEREVDVLRLLAEGHEVREIADRLAFSERTVKNVLHGVLERLGLRNRVQAVSFALRAGLI